MENSLKSEKLKLKADLNVVNRTAVIQLGLNMQ